MNDAEFKSFYADVQLPTSAERAAARRITRGEKLDANELDQMLVELSTADSRERAQDYLKKYELTRRELAAMAKRSQIYIAKEDTVAVIEEKLIEGLVGARLNSLAIRGDGARSQETSE